MAAGLACLSAKEVKAETISIIVPANAAPRVEFGAGKLTEALRAIGFLYVTLDTQGYRSGSMNDVLPVTAIASAM